MWSAAAGVVLLGAAAPFIAGGIARAAGTTVNMVDGSGDPTTTWKFDPADVTVTAGGTVKWHNNGQQPHTVTADDGSFKSSYISPGGDFEHAFPTAGTFAYHCDPHPWMKATVHVTGGTATTAPATATTQPGAATTTTAPAAGATTTTTAKAGASTTTTTAAAGAATTTTAPATSAGGTTATTAAPAQTSGSDTAATTTTTAAAATGGGESAAPAHRQTDSGKTDGPLVALAAVLTLMLIGISGKLLLSKSRPH